MGSINRSHHHETGGVVVFNGELILLFCGSVHCDIDSTGSNTGKIYLTTHRIIFTADKFKSSDKLHSFSAPFYALYDVKLEQPVFGANYIKAKVKSEMADGPPFAFKLKFNSGGAIEFGQTMAQAAKQAATAARDTNFQAPPPYTPSPAEAHYQSAANAYQPMYPVGFALPTQVFNQPPPAGFVFAMDAPPPYPGLTTTVSQHQNLYANQYPSQGPTPASNPYTGNSFPPMAPYSAAPQTLAPQFPAYPNGNGYQSSAPNAAYGTASAPAFDGPPAYDSGFKKSQ